MTKPEIEPDKKPKDYWILKVGDLILKDTGDKQAFTRFLGEARKFASMEDALGFAYGDRPHRGATVAQRIFGTCKGLPYGFGQSVLMTYHLGQELTSVLENRWLWQSEVLGAKLNVK